MATKMISIRFTESEVQLLDYLKERNRFKTRTAVLMMALRSIAPEDDVANCLAVKASFERMKHPPRRRARSALVPS